MAAGSLPVGLRPSAPSGRGGGRRRGSQGGVTNMGGGRRGGSRRRLGADVGVAAIYEAGVRVCTHAIFRGSVVDVRRRWVDLGQRKEQFSIAYLHAIASVAGYRTAEPNVDDDSIDWCVKARGIYGRRRSPQLDLQLKCTERLPNKNGSFGFPLSEKNYSDLRGDDVHVPRILVVVFVPDDIDSWLDQSEERLLMKHCAYWVSLRDAPETSNLKRVTVRLPRTNLFTVSALGSMMQRIGDGGSP